MSLLKERCMYQLIDRVYMACKEELKKPKDQMRNCVQDIYKPFTDQEISNRIVEMLQPEGMTTEIKLVYQSVDGLHNACPDFKGDWYFTGNYPTPGGNKLVNQAFINYVENVYQYETKF